jgi:hypothetical protein
MLKIDVTVADGLLNRSLSCDELRSMPHEILSHKGLWLCRELRFVMDVIVFLDADTVLSKQLMSLSFPTVVASHTFGRVFWLAVSSGAMVARFHQSGGSCARP